MGAKVDFKRILIIQTAAIGDVILCTALIEKMHHHFPDAKIDFLLKKGNEQLFKGHPILHQVLIWDKSKHKYRNLLDLIILVQEMKYDLLINVQRFFSTGLISLLSKAKIKTGFRKNPLSLFYSNSVKHQMGDASIHEIDRNAKLVEKWTNAERVLPKLYPIKAHYAKVSQYKTQTYICIAAASLWKTKELPVEKWIEFLDQLNPATYVYLIGSKEDVEKCNKIKLASNHPNVLILAGKLTFLETTALMKDAKMNYVLDSAPMHMASAINAKTSAIFCSTTPAYGFGPLADQSKIIESDGQLKCKPCGVHGYKRCPKKHFKCGINIDTQKLLNETK